MKEQKIAFPRKRIHFPACSEKRATGFWGLKRLCFRQKLCILHSKREWPSTWSRLYESLRRQRKALRFQRKWAREASLGAEAQVGEDPGPECHLEGDGRKAASRLPGGGVFGGAGDRDRETEAGLTTSTAKANGENEGPGDESGTIVVTLGRWKGRHYCPFHRGQERNGTPGESPSPRPSGLTRHAGKRKSPLLMYTKLSVIRFRHRILKSQQFRTRSKLCKRREGQRSWVQKVTGDQRESLRERFEAGGWDPLPPPGPKGLALRRRHRFSDMDSNAGGHVAKGKEAHTPEGLPKGNAPADPEPPVAGSVSCLPNGSAAGPAPQWGSVQSSGGGGEPASRERPGNLFLSGTEGESAGSGQDAKGSHQVRSVAEDGMKLLTASTADEAMSEDSPSGPEPSSVETLPNEERPGHTDVEGSLNQDVFSAKLLDHPYCKNPLEAPLIGPGLQLGSPVAGGKNGQKASPADDEELSSCLCGFLDEIMKKYGSLVPLCEKDVLGRLKDVFNEDFSNRKPFINREITNYRARHPKPSTCNFRIFYNKHMLDMDDLTTLDGQNWLNDQVINMYGELIMDAVPDKVHFFNSFFHRQLVTKGYNGVRRWTKKVDLFKKRLLLIPIHLEVHWSLITVTLSNRIISFYDSQGIHFKFCVENIRKYLLTEAREKNQPEFLQGWQTAVTKCIPQQKNDSDCGVFVLQMSRTGGRRRYLNPISLLTCRFGW
ncbi:sentrin-specific protease 5 isoform X2 [Tachyglossus aculeatus]|uniref:sentrin-specific protease 5 isoform X2 n=1 Tax=Tachyglossus aculeatus TaxID=9261 RepID=UPI0018F573F9|nr:sentrin-specific protease 5 isoform X2 [Tachyglossus aculeatus]